MLLKFLYVVQFVLLMPFLIQAQIAGRVFENAEQSNLPLTGVNVYWGDQSGGTVSDANGYFKLDVSKSSKMLIFSYIGYH